MFRRQCDLVERIPGQKLSSPSNLWCTRCLWMNRRIVPGLVLLIEKRSSNGCPCQVSKALWEQKWNVGSKGKTHHYTFLKDTCCMVANVQPYICLYIYMCCCYSVIDLVFRWSVLLSSHCCDSYDFRYYILMTSKSILPTLTSLMRSACLLPDTPACMSHCVSEWPLLKLMSHLGTIMLPLNCPSFVLSS